jgi:hypothetical protein
MSKHTPGPWKTDFKISSNAGRVAIEPDIAIIYVQSNRYDGEQSKTRLANAALIAAAPDLLTVCKELAESAAYWSDYDVLLGTVDRLNAAIAKAEGTTT